jgi:mannose-6-phosphate isomerase-like protein (cupin superfamily)
MLSGETIRNDVTGETLTMLESGGVRQLYAVRIPPHRPSPPLHYHVAFAETFTVMEGALDFYLGRERRRVTLGPGHRVTAEIGQPHTFGNDRDEWTTFYRGDAAAGRRGGCLRDGICGGERGRRGKGWPAAQFDRAAELYPDQ